MGAMASQITSLKIVYLTINIQVQIKESIKAPCHCPLCREFTGDRWPVTRKMFPFYDVIVYIYNENASLLLL